MYHDTHGWRDRQSAWMMRYFVFVRWVVPLIALVAIAIATRCQR